MASTSSCELMSAAMGVLEDCELMGSARILAELLLSSENTGVEYKLKALITFADSLVDGQEYRRAICYYKEYLKLYQGLQVTNQNLSHLTDKHPTVAEVKWRIYKCFNFLSAHQEALDTLLSIETADMSPKICMALAKLHQYFHNDRVALSCYKQVLCLNPFAVEAMVGAMTLGMTPPEVLSICKSHGHISSASSSLFDTEGLSVWLDGKYAEIVHDYEGAVKAYGKLTKPPYSSSADLKCTVARCMWKLGREMQAKELFSLARAHDPLTLTHMDLYAQMLSSSKSIAMLEKLVHDLHLASALHHQCYVARAILLASKEKLLREERNKCLLCTAKAIKINPNSPEAHYVQGKVTMMGQDTRKACEEFVQAIRADPTHFGAYKCLVKCYCINGNEEEALAFGKALSKHLKNKAQSHFLEGMVYAHKGANSTKLAKAKAAFLKAIKADALFTEPVLCLAEICDRQQNTAKAIELLSHSIATNPTPKLHSEIAKYHIKLKQYEEAQDHYIKAHGFDSKFQEAVDGMKELNKLISSSEMDQTHSSSPAGSDISVDTVNEELELDLDSEDSTPPADLTNQILFHIQW